MPAVTAKVVVEDGLVDAEAHRAPLRGYPQTTRSNASRRVQDRRVATPGGPAECEWPRASRGQSRPGDSGEAEALLAMVWADG